LGRDEGLVSDLWDSGPVRKGAKGWFRVETWTTRPPVVLKTTWIAAQSGSVLSLISCKT